jgi:predicted transcriptional regulator
MLAGEINEVKIMHQPAVSSVKKSLHNIADQLPEGATWKDVVYEAYTRQEIEDGLNEARRGEFVSDNKLISTFTKWGVSIATQVD